MAPSPPDCSLCLFLSELYAGIKFDFIDLQLLFVLMCTKISYLPSPISTVHAQTHAACQDHHILKNQPLPLFESSYNLYPSALTYLIMCQCAMRQNSCFLCGSITMYQHF